MSPMTDKKHSRFIIKRQTMEETALEETFRILYRDHPKSPTGITHKDGLAVFNWLVIKSCLGRNPEPFEFLNIERSQIRSTREEKSTAELKEIQELGKPPHVRANPRPKVGKGSPIIIVEYKGKTLLIDGSNRINMWHRDRNTELHRVNFHRIADG